MGLVEVDIEGHGGLRLGPDCRDVLRGERRIELRRDEPRRRATKPAGRAGEIARNPEVEARFAALRACRMTLARAQGVPPYVIFHDATLLAIADAVPRSLDELARIPGVGAAKLERYGRTILAAVNADDG
jgi:ATP-dependent DNA helicase RecQ